MNVTDDNFYILIVFALLFIAFFNLAFAVVFEVF